MDDEFVYIVTLDNELDDGYQNIAVAKTLKELMEELKELLTDDFELKALSDNQMKALEKENCTHIIDDFGIKYTLNIEKWYL